MTVSDKLKQAIVDSGETHYRIGKEAGVSVKSLDWFVSGERPYLRSDTIDRLCEYLSLELRPKKQRKRARKSEGTATKQRRKKTQ